MSGATLEDVFVEEGIRVLAVFHESTLDPRARQHACNDLEVAANFLPSAELRANAQTICVRLRQSDAAAVDELAELIAELRASQSRDVVPRPIPKRTDSSRQVFDTEETRTLRSFFRDEAHQNLERVVRTLGEVGSEAPSESTIDELLRITHLLKGSAGTVGLPEFANAAHSLEDALARARRGSIHWTKSLHDSIIEVIDALLAFVDTAEEGTAADSALANLELRVASLTQAWTDAETTATTEPRREPRSESSSVTMTPAESQSRGSGPQVLRVDPRRVDQLMDSVGELTFDRTRIERRIHEVELLSQNLSHARRVLHDSIEQLAAGENISDDIVVIASQLSELEADIASQVAAMRRSSSNLIEDARSLRKTTAELQKGLTGIRMQSAAALFERLAPRVRAMARAEGKRVRLRMLGGETEFDKAVAEQVADALIQLLRNSIAHGIESQADRAAAGKPEVGLITLTARGEGESVAIEVADDGAGLDTVALRRRLVELDVWSEDRASSESDDGVLRAVFFPGVSSRVSADLIAGRGVGLGAVRETVARLGGEIRLASTRGRGTTFTVRLPLTTAIAHALLFKVGGHVYAVPNVNVVETALVEASGPTIPAQLRTRGQTVPMILLQSVLGADIPSDARSVPAVVIEYLGRRLAITCDKIVGPREIVVKSLGPLLASIPLYAGGTVSGSGKVQLILDPAALVRLAFPTLEVIDDGPTRIRRNAGSRARRVLIVDDSRSVRLAVTRALERAGFLVDEAPDGAAGWERLCSSDYDVMITDIEMPELDGFGLLERVRSSTLAHLPALIISTRAGEGNRARAESLGVSEFFAKPVSPQALAAGVERALGIDGHIESD